MKDNSTIVIVDGKKFFIDDIKIIENKVSYDIYCLQDITEYDKQNIDSFVMKLLSGDYNGSN